MAKIIIEKKTFSPIIDTQRSVFFESLKLKEKNGTYELSYEDKNFLCKPYLEVAMQSKIQGLSFGCPSKALPSPRRHLWHRQEPHRARVCL